MYLILEKAWSEMSDQNRQIMVVALWLFRFDFVIDNHDGPNRNPLDQILDLRHYNIRGVLDCLFSYKIVEPSSTADTQAQTTGTDLGDQNADFGIDTPKTTPRPGNTRPKNRGRNG